MTADLHAVLAGLQEELRASKVLSRDNVGEIEAEIARVEELLKSQTHPLDANVRRSVRNPAVVTPSGRAKAYLASLKEELRSVKGDRKKAVEAEIARVEAEVNAGPVVERATESAPERAVTAPGEPVVPPARSRRTS